MTLPFSVESIAPDDGEWLGAPLNESRTDTEDVS